MPAICFLPARLLPAQAAQLEAQRASVDGIEAQVVAEDDVRTGRRAPAANDLANAKRGDASDDDGGGEGDKDDDDDDRRPHGGDTTKPAAVAAAMEDVRQAPVDRSMPDYTTME